MELFADPSWLQVMVGQRMRPKAHHPFAELRPEAEVATYVGHIEQVIAKCVKVMPTHADYIAKHCAATPP
jgi:tryptophan halogenase